MKEVIYKSIDTKDYKNITKMIEKLADETNYYPFTSQDYNISEEEQKAFIGKMNSQENCFILGCFDNDILVGVVYLYGGNRARNYHSCTLGIGVLKDYSNMGIGSNLISKAIDYAYNCDVIGKINIQVVKENKRAINFYKKYNFQIEGIEKRSLFIDGRFYDSVNLGLVL